MLKAEGERVYIEYCRDCARHQWCTKHVEEKYSSYFNACRSEIMDLNPEVSVRGNEVPPTLRNKFTEEGSTGLPSIGKLSFPRMGAFEVFVRGKYIFSKLESGHWPHPGAIAAKIKEILDQLRLPPAIPESKRTSKKKKTKRKKKSKKASHSVSPIADRKVSRDPAPRSDLTPPKQTSQTSRSLHEVEPPKLKSEPIPAKAPELKGKREETTQEPPRTKEKDSSSSSRKSETERFDVETLHQEFKQEEDNYEDDYEDRFEKHSEGLGEEHKSEKDDEYSEEERPPKQQATLSEGKSEGHKSEKEDEYSEDEEPPKQEEASHHSASQAGEKRQSDEQRSEEEPQDQQYDGDYEDEAGSQHKGDEQAEEGGEEGQYSQDEYNEGEQGEEQNAEGAKQDHGRDPEEYEDQDYEDGEPAHPKREVTQRFELKLKVGVESNKKISYENKRSEATVFLLSSSDETVMEVKEPEVAIEGNGKGKFQLKFCAVDRPCEVTVYLYVDEDDSPVECIEITARFQD